MTPINGSLRFARHGVGSCPKGKGAIHGPLVAHLRQKDMRRSTNTVKISSRPKSIEKTKIHLHSEVALSPQEWYMVLANHQSWVDILILHRVFNNKIPFLKFFLKKELIFVPILGLA